MSMYKKKMDRVTIQKLAKKYALANALQYGGHPQINAVAGKIMAELKNSGVDHKIVYSISGSICREIETLSFEEQLHIIQKDYPELLVKEERKKEKKTLPPLPNAVRGEVITRFPPEPNGYLHIGHAKAAFIDYEYARMYDGLFILRFDDTNPSNEQKEFYTIQKNDLRWLGIDWDREYRTSDNLPKHYELARILMENKNAYICCCNEDEIKLHRQIMKRCTCSDKNEFTWNDFLKMKEGTAVLRLKADMQSANSAMRDPVLFRVIEYPHPIHGTRFRIWPTYDFYGAVEDSLSGVTHPFRSKEYELRDEVYFFLLERLQLRKPYLLEFSRLDIEGMPVSKRKIKPLIDSRVVNGWDDPRLPTLQGLCRRGIMMEAIKEFVLAQGISKSESVVVFENLEAINRKLLDGIAKRYFFVPNPVRLYVDGAPEKKVVLRAHPSVDMGTRTIHVNQTFYIPQDDAKALKINEVFRLKDLCNVRVTEIGEHEIRGMFDSETLIDKTSKIQWVTEDHLSLSIDIPSLLYVDGIFNEKSIRTVSGFAESLISDIKQQQIVQFERFGFVRLERDNNGVIRGIRAHG